MDLCKEFSKAFEMIDVEPSRTVEMGIWNYFVNYFEEYVKLETHTIMQQEKMCFSSATQ